MQANLPLSDVQVHTTELRNALARVMHSVMMVDEDLLTRLGYVHPSAISRVVFTVVGAAERQSLLGGYLGPWTVSRSRRDEQGFRILDLHAELPLPPPAPRSGRPLLMMQTEALDLMRPDADGGFLEAVFEGELSRVDPDDLGELQEYIDGFDDVTPEELHQHLQRQWPTPFQFNVNAIGLSGAPTTIRVDVDTQADMIEFNGVRVRLSGILQGLFSKEAPRVLTDNATPAAPRRGRKRATGGLSGEG